MSDDFFSQIKTWSPDDTDIPAPPAMVKIWDPISDKNIPPPPGWVDWSQKAKDAITSFDDRRKLLDIIREVPEAQWRPFLRAAYKEASQMDRGGRVSRFGKSVRRGMADVSQPIMEMLNVGGTEEEQLKINELLNIEQATIAPVKEGDPWYESGPMTAARMLPLALTAGASASKAGAIAKASGAGAWGIRGAQAAGTTAAMFPAEYQGNYKEMIQSGIDPATAQKAAGIIATINGALESIIPDPFNEKGIVLTQGAKKAATSFLIEYMKRYGGELSEEVLQGATSGAGQAAAEYLNGENPDMKLGDIFTRSMSEAYEQGKAAAVPLGFMMLPAGAIGTANAAITTAHPDVVQATEATNTLRAMELIDQADQGKAPSRRGDAKLLGIPSSLTKAGDRLAWVFSPEGLAEIGKRFPAIQEALDAAQGDAKLAVDAIRNALAPESAAEAATTPAEAPVAEMAPEGVPTAETPPAAEGVAQETVQPGPEPTEFEKRANEYVQAVPVWAGSDVTVDEGAKSATVTRKDGRSTTVHFDADAEVEAMAAKKGPAPARGAYVYKTGKPGKYQEGHIYLRSDAGPETPNHEAFHWMEDEGIVTPEEVAAHGGREGIAKAYAEWVVNERKEPDSVFQRIWEFLENIFQTRNALFRDIEKRGQPTQETAEEPTGTTTGTTTGTPTGTPPTEPPGTYVPKRPGRFPKTGTANAMTDESKVARGKEPGHKYTPGTLEGWDAEARERMTADPAWVPDMVAATLVNPEPRPLTKLEEAGLGIHLREIHNRLSDAIDELVETRVTGDDIAVEEAKAKTEAIEKQLDEAIKVAETVGTEAGQAFNARKMISLEDYSLGGIRKRAYKKTEGEALTEKEEEAIRTTAKELETWQKKLNEAQQQIDEQAENEAIERAFADAENFAPQTLDGVPADKIPLENVKRRASFIGIDTQRKGRNGLIRKINELEEHILVNFANNQKGWARTIEVALHDILPTLSAEHEERRAAKKYAHEQIEMTPAQFLDYAKNGGDPAGIAKFDTALDKVASQYPQFFTQVPTDIAADAQDIGEREQQLWELLSEEPIRAFNPMSDEVIAKAIDHALNTEMLDTSEEDFKKAVALSRLPSESNPKKRPGPAIADEGEQVQETFIETGTGKRPWSKSSRRKAVEERIASEWNEFREAFRKSISPTSGGINPELLKPVLKLVRSYVELEVVTLVDFIKEAKKWIGDIAEDQRELFKEAWNQVKAEGTIPTPDISAEDTDGIRKYARELLLDMVEMRREKGKEIPPKVREEIVDDIWEELKGIKPEMTRQEAQIAISGHGIYKPAPANETKKRATQLQGEIHLQLQINEAEYANELAAKWKAEGVSQEEINSRLEKRGLYPKMKGVGRQPPSKSSQDLRRQFNQEKKTLPGESARSTKSTLHSRMASVATSIRIMNEEIETRKRLVKEKGESATSPELEELIRVRDELRKEWRAIFKPAWKPRKRTAAQAEAAAQKRIAKLKEQLRTGNFEEKQKDKPESLVRQEIQDEIKLLEKRKKAAKKAQQESQLADWEGEGGALAPKKKRKPSKPRRPLTDGEKITRSEAMLKKSLAALEKMLDTGDIAPRRPTSKPWSKHISELNAKIKPLRQKVMQARDQGRYTEYLERRDAELSRQLREGVKFPEPKKERVLTKEQEKIQYEIAKKKELIDAILEKMRRDRMTKSERTFDFAKESVNASRAIITSIDFSAALRQGGFIVASHPLIAAKAVPGMFGSFFGGASDVAQTTKKLPGAVVEAVREVSFKPLRDMFMEYAENAKRYAFLESEKIRNSPRGSFYNRIDLAITNERGGYSKMEEVYIGRWSNKMPFIAASERAYVAFLNRIRADVCDTMIDSLGGVDGVTTAQGKVIAKFINSATGRGSLPGLEASAVTLAYIFFSPRFVASRFQILFGTSMWGGDAKTRKAIAKEYARALAGIGTFYAMVYLAAAMLWDDDDPDKPTVDFDFRSSDGGKVKVGNTRIDPLAGFSQAFVFMDRLWWGETKSSTTKLVTDIRGENVPFGGQTVAGLVGDQITQKLAPIWAEGWDHLRGETREYDPETGEKVRPSLVRSIRNLTTPLSMRDIHQEMKEAGVPQATATGLIQIFGASVDTYGGDMEEILGRLAEKVAEGKKPSRMDEGELLEMSRAIDALKEHKAALPVIEGTLRRRLKAKKRDGKRQYSDESIQEWTTRLRNRMQ